MKTLSAETDPAPVRFNWSTFPGYEPLRDSETGLVGQVGWLPYGKHDRIPVYDPESEVWECERSGGGMFHWRHSTQCYGVPVGHCQRPQEGNGVYCRECSDRMSKQAQRNEWEEKVTENKERLISEGAIPSWFRNWTPPGLTAQQAAASVDFDAGTSSLYIYGDRGRGKTILGCALLYNALQRGRTVAYADAAVLEQARHDRRLRLALGACDLLLVDDIDKGNLSEFGVSIIHSVLDERHNARRRTIITSEFEAGKVNALLTQASNGRYGNSTLERLNFPGRKCVTVRLEGKNLRKETACND